MLVALAAALLLSVADQPAASDRGRAEQLLMSDVATGSYMGRGDLLRLVATVLLETCGYRQLNSWWGCVGTVQAISGKGGWGTMRRRAFVS